MGLLQLLDTPTNLVLSVLSTSKTKGRTTQAKGRTTQTELFITTEIDIDTVLEFI